ncbi:MAG: hypothetical protein WC986_14580 [Elusimicrobiota bacterium]|jgi:hypothetical protein
MKTDPDTLFGPIPLKLDKLPDDIAALARLVRKDWKKVHYSAVPYLEAMAGLHEVTDYCLVDRADGIILRFLGNAKTWRGPVAKAVKAKLNSLVAR